MENKTYTARIFGESEEIFQDVHYSFEHIVKHPSFFENEGNVIEVNHLEIKMPLYIKPADIETDLSETIRMELGLRPCDVVKIECQIQYSISSLVNEIAA